MGTNECSQSASKPSWDIQDFGGVRMVLKMVHFRKSTRPQWVNNIIAELLLKIHHEHILFTNANYVSLC